MDFQYTHFVQNGQRFLSMVLPFNIIYDNSYVLVYGKFPGGYQRDPEAGHVIAIRNYILDDPKFILPTSIVLAIDEEYLVQISNSDSDIRAISLENDPANGRCFRIVDGQHRLRGIKEASLSNPELLNLPLQVLVLVTSAEGRSVEMEVFAQINSKSKRIKVDLIELAKFEYQILEFKVEVKDLAGHIALRAAKQLNEISESNVWYNAIKFGIHEEEKTGIIGVHAFKDSLVEVVNSFLAMDTRYLTLQGKELITFSISASESISEFIRIIWWEIVREKWRDCFYKDIDFDFFMEIKETYYNKDCYIQKTLGTKSIHRLVANATKLFVRKAEEMQLQQKFASNQKEHEIMDLFLNTTRDALRYEIYASEVKSSDWLLGGPFSGYSSESGFLKVSKMINGEVSVPRQNN